MVWLSIDYAAQEIRVAAALSQDRALIETYLKEQSQPFLLDSNGLPLVRSNGQPFKNPETDVYIQTAIQTFPEMQGLRPEEIEDKANEPLKGGGTRRKKSKTLFIGIIYGMSAHSLAGRLNVEVKEAKKMIELFFAKYSQLEEFLKQSQFEAQHQRFVRNAIGRIIFVNESNAKGQADSGAVARKGANAKIQGLSSDITKLGFVRTHRTFKQLDAERRAVDEAAIPARIGFPVHDELNALAPGEIGVRFEPDGKFPGCCKPVSFFQDPPTPGELNAKRYADAMQSAMETAMSDILSPIIRDRFGVDFPAKAETNIHRYWKH